MVNPVLPQHFYSDIKYVTTASETYYLS